MTGTIGSPQIQYGPSLTRLRRLARMFEKMDDVCWQKYLDWPNIENWSDESNRIVLVGESARPLMVRTSVSYSAYALRTALISS